MQNLLLIKVILSNYEKCLAKFQPTLSWNAKNLQNHNAYIKNFEKLQLTNTVQKGVAKMKHSPDLTNAVRSFRTVGHFCESLLELIYQIKNIKILSGFNYLFGKF